jgi:hypothetical protein
MVELSHERFDFASRFKEPDGGWRTIQATIAASESEDPAVTALPPEVAFLSRFALAPDRLAAALRDIERGAAPDAAVLGDGLLDEDDFYEGLAQALGCVHFTGEIAFGEAFDPSRALRSGLAPLAPNRLGLGAVIAPRGSTIPRLVEAVASGRLSADAFAVASPRRLAALIRLRDGQAILDDALLQPSPALSARGGVDAREIAAIVVAIIASCALGVACPSYFRDFLTIAIWLVFSSAVLLRSCALISGGSPRVVRSIEDRELPVYSVVVALYDEAEVVKQLVEALNAFDYVGIMAHPPQAIGRRAA